MVSNSQNFPGLEVLSKTVILKFQGLEVQDNLSLSEEPFNVPTPEFSASLSVRSMSRLHSITDFVAQLRIN